ncbi:MAG: hypothetical protein LBH70_02670 [Spirochaetaceae bacterium]|jgi:hypothetical protein|nr:hypothetical protein [Spirochaetaceae bacterium]
MVYLAKKNGAVVHHTDRAAMEALDGIETPDMEIGDEEFEAAGGLVRLIDGEIFPGKTGAEKQAGENAGRVHFLKSLLADTDYIAARIAEGSATVEEYAGKIARRRAWRQEIAELEAPA